MEVINTKDAKRFGVILVQIQMSKKKIIVAVVLVILILSFSLLGIQSLNNRNAYKDAYRLRDGWSLSINADIREGVNLEKEIFEPIDKGDVLVLERTIPECRFQEPMLRIWMCHCAFRVLVNQEEVYSFGFAELENNRLIGTGYHWVKLPSDCGKKGLRIEVYPGENDALTNIDTIVMSDASDAYPDFISGVISSVCVGIFLVIFGVCLILVTICLKCFSKGFNQLIYSGIFSCLIGIWTLCNKGVVSLISSDRVMNQLVEHSCVDIGMIPILLFICSTRSKEPDGNRKSKLLFWMPRFLAAMNVIAYFVLIILQALNIFHLPMAISFFHVYMVLAACYVIYSCIEESRKGNIHEAILLIGMLILGICFLIDIIIFAIAKYYNGTLSKYMGLSAWGCIAFVLCMLASYGFYVYKGIISKLEKETLLKMAYVDHLTKLANSAKFKETMQEYNKHNIRYTLINFDVNGLKQVNDRYGHEEGNVLLTDFSAILKSVFNKDGLVARVGGDEFYVLLPWENEEQIAENMSKFEREMKKANLGDRRYPMEAAWGIAKSSECVIEKSSLSGENHSDPEKVVKLADSRMYNRKKKMKEEMKEEMKS